MRACMIVHAHALGRRLRFESTLRMCYNDILSATTAAGICRMSLSTNSERETRTETDTGIKHLLVCDWEKNWDSPGKTG